MKTFGRIAVATAATLTLALAPVGIASAQSAGSAPRDHREDVSITLTDGQRTAVLKARSDYITAASGIRTTYRDAVEGILDAARATTASAQLAYDIAKDAYAITRATGGDPTTAKADARRCCIGLQGRAPVRSHDRAAQARGREEHCADRAREGRQ